MPEAYRAATARIDLHTDHCVDANGKAQVNVDGEWTDVPPEKIRPYPSLDMNTHVRAPPAAWGNPKGTIFCVVLGSGE
jgi:hypothetical protein